ncbi:MAG: DUF2459 domain-containing protein [Gammaproteobacteria bacterium]|nr:MAG: DUF2459 domain-containing protein [Gammaproteobacteria bacterium]
MKYLLCCGFFLSILLSGCASAPPMKNIPLTNTKHTIYFIYRGWHTSILLDAKSLAANVPQLEADLGNQKYVRVGWGDGDYFTGKNKSFTSATKALVASGYSAVQLLPYDYEPFDEIPSDTRVPIAITEQGLRDLTLYIGQSIKLEEGRMLRLPTFGDATGLFFQANSSYGAFSNCNTWSAHALRVAGLPIANRLTAQGVFKQASFISQFQSGHGLIKKLP